MQCNAMLLLYHCLTLQQVTLHIMVGWPVLPVLYMMHASEFTFITLCIDALMSYLTCCSPFDIPSRKR